MSHDCRTQPRDIVGLAEEPHRRFNPLVGRWVGVSAGRAARPWQGATEATSTDVRPTYDPSCYLCPGNVRADGSRNPSYAGTFAFENDFAALTPDTATREVEPHPLLRAHTQTGICRVLCFSPRHDLTLADMSAPELQAVVDLWFDQYVELSATYRWVQIFENKGVGVSNPHPHGQVWASMTLPSEPAAEDNHQRDYLARHGTPLLVEYARLEIVREERVVAVNDSWVAVVPFWAAWPFETLVLPRRHVPRLSDLGTDERRLLGDVLHELLGRYDGLFDHPFPYSLGWHGAPGPADEPAAHWQVHAHFYPPLLSSPTVRKWMVGYDMLADPQRDLTPEESAARLRQVPVPSSRPKRLQP